MSSRLRRSMTRGGAIAAILWVVATLPLVYAFETSAGEGQEAAALIALVFAQPVAGPAEWVLGSLAWTPPFMVAIAALNGFVLGTVLDFGVRLVTRGAAGDVPS